MSNEDFEKNEELIKLCKKVMQAEQERLDGAWTRSISQARKQLRERQPCRKY